MQARQSVDAAAWLHAHAIVPRDGERLVSLFSYDNPAQAAMLQALEDAPTPLLLTPGAAEPPALPSGMCAAPAPALFCRKATMTACCGAATRTAYAAKIRSCGPSGCRPFVWQIYPQTDQAHASKLSAFLDRFPPLSGLRELWLGWNGPYPSRNKCPRSAPGNPAARLGVKSC